MLPRIERTFGSETRAPFELSNPLKAEELAYLGYVSGELPTTMSRAHQAILGALGELPYDVTAETIKQAAKARGVDIERELSTISSRQLK